MEALRVNNATTAVIRPWFNYLAIPHLKAIKASNRYNMDEAGIMEGVGVNSLVLGSSKSRSL